MPPYLSIVQIRKAPHSPEGSNSKVCVMSLAKFERFIDRVVPSFLLFLGLTAAVATAGLGI